MSFEKNNINEVENEIRSLKKKKSDLLKQVQYRASKNYRKERARRLIETGALAEKYFEIENLSIPEKEELFKMFSPFIIGNKTKKHQKK